MRKYDFDYIKIDKSFAEDLENAGDGAKIVSALAKMGGDLGLKVIVEGVESRPAAKAAAALGCAFGQGYALGRPGAAPWRDDDKQSASASQTLEDKPEDNPAPSKNAAKNSDDKDKPDEALELTPAMSAPPEKKSSGWRPLIRR